MKDRKGHAETKILMAINLGYLGLLFFFIPSD